MLAGYGGATVLCTTIAAVVVCEWLSRREKARINHGVTLLLLSFTAATLSGPFIGEVRARWALAVALFLVMYAAIFGVEVVALLRRASAAARIISTRTPIH